MNLNPRYTNLQLTNQVLVAVMSSTGELYKKLALDLFPVDDIMCNDAPSTIFSDVPIFSDE